MTAVDRPTLSVAETAAMLGISRWLVQQAVRDGSLPSLRLGRRILIPRARLQAWLDGAGLAPEGVVTESAALSRSPSDDVAPVVARLRLG